MFRLDADHPVEFCDGLRRRDFLHAGTLSFLGLTLPGVLGLKALGSTDPAKSGKNCIILFLVGGPSQLDTWDPKPDAPTEIRGPYKAIDTNVNGIQISENFPRMAKHADKYALIRSCYHNGAAVHDAGHRTMQNGFLVETSDTLVTALRVDGRGDWREMIDHSVSKFEASRDARLLDSAFHSAYSLMSSIKARDAFELNKEPESVRQKYGLNRFGRSCLLARRLIEAGVRFVTVNMFETVFDEITWDIHGFKPFSPISCYRDLVGPMYDMAYSALLEDLDERGLLSDTLVVSMGEFGRTPKINSAGGRDHWPQCWTILMAGGGVKGGQVVGASDDIAGEPKDRPVSPGEVAATIYHSLGIPLAEPGIKPVAELFA